MQTEPAPVNYSELSKARNVLNNACEAQLSADDPTSAEAAKAVADAQGQMSDVLTRIERSGLDIGA
jgi:hypothetical protein